MYRNIDTHPYSKDEIRVVEYLNKLLPDIGAGDDPIGFLLASHSSILHNYQAQTMELLKKK